MSHRNRDENNDHKHYAEGAGCLVELPKAIFSTAIIALELFLKGRN